MYEKNSRYLVFLLFVLSVYVFFGYLFPNNISYILLAVSAISLLFYPIIRNRQTFTPKQLAQCGTIILFAVYQLASSLNSINLPKGAILKGIVFLIGALFYLYTDWYEKGIKIFFIFASVHVLFTVISYFFPSFFQTIVLPQIPSEIRYGIIFFKLRGTYSGITEQIGRNAYYISVGISILFSNFIHNKSKSNYVKIIMIAVYFLALLLTGKRGPLVANIAAMTIVFIYDVSKKKNSKLINILKISLILLLIMSVLFIVFPESFTPIQRMILTQESGDITSGRIPLYLGAIELFKQKPVFGWGTAAFSNIYGTGTHNMYLQLLAENGIVGFAIFVFILFRNFVITRRFIKREVSSNNKEHSRRLYFSLYIQVFFIIYGLTGNPTNDVFILLIYLIASSIPFSLRKKTDINKMSSLDMGDT